jgi:hypothetical protein
VPSQPAATIGAPPPLPLSPRLAEPIRNRAPFALRVRAGTYCRPEPYAFPEWETRTMDSIIYLVGLVVVIMFVLSLLGLR